MYMYAADTCMSTRRTHSPPVFELLIQQHHALLVRSQRLQLLLKPRLIELHGGNVPPMHKSAHSGSHAQNVMHRCLS